MSKARTLSLAAVSLSLATAATLAFGMADFREQVSTAAQTWNGTTHDWRHAALDEALPSHGLAAPTVALRPAAYNAPPSKPVLIVSDTPPAIGQPFRYQSAAGPERTIDVTSLRLVGRSGDKLLIEVAGTVRPADGKPTNEPVSLLIETRAGKDGVSSQVRSL